MNELIEQFRQAIESAGLNPPDEITNDGKIHRFSSNGKPRDESGWYVLHSDGVAAGAFGCWREGFTQNWCSKSTTEMTRAEREAHRNRVQAMKAQRDSELEHRNELAAVNAASRFKAATTCTSHPYLTTKGVQAHGIRLEGDNLLIPMRDTAGKLHSLQTITPDGDKRFMTGGRVKGCYLSIGKPTGKLIVCEGYATGASIFEATGEAVAVVFNAGNLEPVAQALRAKYAYLQIVLAADDDYQTEGNPGMTKARAAAVTVGAYMAVPYFGDNRPEKATDFNDLQQIAGLEAVTRCIESAIPLIAVPARNTGSTGQNDVWLEPRKIKADLPPAPAFDALALLPKTLADFVLDEADRMPCPPDYVASALIVALGSVIGTKCALKPKRRDDWIVTPNLYGGVVGDPSAKKTPAVNTAMRFLDRLAAKEAELLAEREKIHQAEIAAFEAHQGAVKASMKKAASGKTDALKMTAAMQDLQDLAQPEKPYPRRFKTNDASVAKLGDLLVHNPFGMLVFRDEVIGLLSSWDKPGNEGDKAFYLEGWNGTGGMNIDRIGRGELYVKNLCLSVFGGIQPDLLERYLSGITNSLDNDGRIQRFQVLVYPNAVGWEWRDRYPVKGAREAVRDLFDRLAYFEPLQDGAAPADDFVKLPHLCFDDAAQDLFIEWSTELHRELIAKEQNPLMQQHFGKFEKLFCAVALILHLAEGNIGPVQVDSAIRAAAWCEYLAGHARRIYGLVEVGKINTARSLGRRIAQGKLPDRFTARDVSKKGWASISTTTEAENALSVLEEFGHVVSYETSEQPGRPTTRYQINPKTRRLP